jgi:hypothetical protein
MPPVPHGLPPTQVDGLSPGPSLPGFAHFDSPRVIQKFGDSSETLSEAGARARDGAGGPAYPAPIGGGVPVFSVSSTKKPLNKIWTSWVGWGPRGAKPPDGGCW